ncbi:hypothetical protein ACVJBD_001792 [Rhizobium mongolense]
MNIASREVRLPPRPPSDCCSSAQSALLVEHDRLARRHAEPTSLTGLLDRGKAMRPVMPAHLIS